MCIRDRLWNLLIFGVMQIVFIPTIGGSIGHRIMRLQLVPLAGGWVGPWRPVVRTVLLMLVIPVLVWDSDQRGFHDTVSYTHLDVYKRQTSPRSCASSRPIAGSTCRL